MLLFLQVFQGREAPDDNWVACKIIYSVNYSHSAKKHIVVLAKDATEFIQIVTMNREKEVLATILTNLRMLAT